MGELHIGVMLCGGKRATRERFSSAARVSLTFRIPLSREEQEKSKTRPRLVAPQRLKPWRGIQWPGLFLFIKTQSVDSKRSGLGTGLAARQSQGKARTSKDKRLKIMLERQGDKQKQEKCCGSPRSPRVKSRECCLARPKVGRESRVREKIQ